MRDIGSHSFDVVYDQIETRNQLIRMIRYSSNQDATALLRRVGMERLAEILQEWANRKRQVGR
ncbi:MAG: hypothetical protein GY850_27750 [bacterium]|nr:hypothetical protein [bacterium]